MNIFTKEEINNINKDIIELNLTPYAYIKDLLKGVVHSSYIKGNYGQFEGYFILENNKQKFNFRISSNKREITEFLILTK